MHNWQIDLLDKMTKYKGKGVVQITGRQTGKSYFSAQALKRLMDDLMLIPITDLVLSEGKVYGSRYYCVEPVGGNWREMEDWCIQTCGETTGSIWAEEVKKTTPMPGERWYANNRKFWFREEKDRTMFLLKWRWQ
jgi:hypothetical protein